MACQASMRTWAGFTGRTHGNKPDAALCPGSLSAREGIGGFLGLADQPVQAGERLLLKDKAASRFHMYTLMYWITQGRLHKNMHTYVHTNTHAHSHTASHTLFSPLLCLLSVPGLSHSRLLTDIQSSVGFLARKNQGLISVFGKDYFPVTFDICRVSVLQVPSKVLGRHWRAVNLAPSSSDFIVEIGTSAFPRLQFIACWYPGSYHSHLLTLYFLCHFL